MIPPRLRTGIRAVALFEAVKGTVMLLAGFGALSLLHRDVHALAMALVGRLHLDPTHKLPGVFLQAASQVHDLQLWMWAGLAAAYSLFRFIEGYGLWKQRAWGEWLAVISGGIYLPLEVYELVRRMTWIRFTALGANLLVVLFMAVVLYRSHLEKSQGPRTRSDQASSAPTVRDARS